MALFLATFRRLRDDGVQIHHDALYYGSSASHCGAGRRDADAADPVGRMPAETLTAEQLRSAFAAKGISEQELVALSGAHTVPPRLQSSRSLPLSCNQDCGQPEEPERQCHHSASSFSLTSSAPWIQRHVDSAS